MNALQQSRLSHAFCTALSIFDESTGGHCLRVAILAEQIAAQLALDSDSRLTARHAGMLHDLGKVAVDPEVLNTDGPLDERQWAEVRCHPAIGGDMLLAISADLRPVATAVREHHERVDGGGYPDGLGGGQISLVGRIVAAADVYDALTSARLYRERAFTHGEACEHLAAAAGTHLDAAVVAAAQSVLVIAS